MPRLIKRGSPWRRNERGRQSSARGSGVAARALQRAWQAALPRNVSVRTAAYRRVPPTTLEAPPRLHSSSRDDAYHAGRSPPSGAHPRFRDSSINASVQASFCSQEGPGAYGSAASSSRNRRTVMVSTSPISF